MQRLLISAMVGGIAALGAADPAEGCTCIRSGPACQAYWTTDLVFDATVISLGEVAAEREADRRFAFPPDKLVRLKVHRAWKGLDGSDSEIEAVTAGQDSACGYGFEKNVRYLVFARRRPQDGRIGVSLCSATKPFDGTGPDAEFLASLSQPARGGRLFGQVLRSEQHLDWNMSAVREPLDGVEVIADGPGGRRETVTRRGVYQFTGLSAGSYSVQVRLPEGLRQPNAPVRAEIADARACSEVDFWTRSTGRITGQVIGLDGRPVANVQVEAIAAAPRTKYGQGTVRARTDSGGWYELEDLPPGRFLVGINVSTGFARDNPYPPIYYRASELGEPTVVELSRGESTTVPPLVVPPVPAEVRLSGTVVWSDGRPVTSGDVFVSDITDEPPRGAGGTQTDATGAFKLSLREGRRYRIQARAFERGTRTVIAAGHLIVVAATGQEPTRIVVQPVK